MLFLAVLLLLQCGGAFGAHGCHHNHHGLTEEDVIRMVMDDMDHDKNIFITTDELSREFVTRFDHNGDSVVSESEFVKVWHSTYHDSKEFAAKVYMFLVSGQPASTLTIAGAPQIVRTHDINGDGKLSYGEFKTALLKVCVRKRADDCKAPVPHYTLIVNLAKVECKLI